MNKHEQPMGVDPEIKEEINKEGFEGDAAILIGKKEDMPRMLEKLESEGKTEDLGTYIKLHKEILLPIDNGQTDKKTMLEMKGQGKFFSPDTLRYIDKDGNYCQVTIDTKKIAQLQKFEVAEHMIRKLGFNLSSENSFNSKWQSIMHFADIYKRTLQEDAEKSNKENFDF